MKKNFAILAMTILMAMTVLIGCGGGGGGDAPPRTVSLAGEAISGYGNTSFSWIRYGFDGCAVYASALVGPEADTEIETALSGLTSITARVENNIILARASDGVEVIKFEVSFTDFEAAETTSEVINGVPVSYNSSEAFWSVFFEADFVCEDETPDPEPGLTEICFPGLLADPVPGNGALCLEGTGEIVLDAYFGGVRYSASGTEAVQRELEDLVNTALDRAIQLGHSPAVVVSELRDDRASASFYLHSLGWEGEGEMPPLPVLDGTLYFEEEVGTDV